MQNNMRSKTAFKTFSDATNEVWFCCALVLTRVTLGVLFFTAGIAKFGGWSAAGYLNSATGPLASFFQSLAGSLLVDQLNLWGLILIGLALIIGLMVRPAGFFGALMMTLYYLAQFEQNTAHGYIDEHIIYALVLILLMAGGAGHVFGLDGLISGNLRKKKKLLTIFFG